MIASCIDRLLHETRRLIGRILASGRLHRIQYSNVDGAEIVLKSRRFGSGVAIVVGNLYLHLQRGNVEVLTGREWLRWELAVESATNCDIVIRSHSSPHENFRGLISRVSPGLPLRNILIDSTRSFDEKFAAIRWAMAALHQLHRHQADWGNGIQQSISHGDATVNNVIVNSKTQSARWIDFDTRHLPRLPEPDRHADDLRALIFSAAANLPRSCFPHLAAEFVASSPTSVVHQFRQRLTTDWYRPNTFQLAQAPLSWKDSADLSQALLQALPVIGTPLTGGIAAQSATPFIAR